MRLSALLNILWRGDAMLDRMGGATERAVNDTLRASVEDAQASAPVRTGTYRSSIRTGETGRSGVGTFGEFGSYGVRYAFYVNVGARGIPPNPNLRNAFDNQVGQLKGRVKSSLGRVT